MAAQNGAFRNPILNALGKLWTLPNTIVAGTLGLLSIPFGGRPQFGNNAIEFLNFPFGPDGALTLGNVILYRNTLPNSVDVFYGVSQLLGRHELAHTFQAQILGPFYPPGYVALGGFPSASHPFESAASNFAKFLGGFWP